MEEGHHKGDRRRHPQDAEDTTRMGEQMPCHHEGNTTRMGEQMSCHHEGSITRMGEQMPCHHEGSTTRMEEQLSCRHKGWDERCKERTTRMREQLPSWRELQEETTDFASTCSVGTRGFILFFSHERVILSLICCCIFIRPPPRLHR